jgi:hypothetical protein
MKWRGNRRAALLGVVVGAGLTVVGLAVLPGIENPAVAPITTRGENGALVESFFFTGSRDVIAITHNGKLPLGASPPGIPLFSEAAIDKGFALITQIRNAAGEIVGYAAELEVHPEGDMLTQNLTWNTDWVLVLPARGALFLHQQEHFGRLREVMPPVLAGKGWSGDLRVQTTVGPRPDGRGVILGGTGEFAGARGAFIEIDHLTQWTTGGQLVARLELRLEREAVP